MEHVDPLVVLALQRRLGHRVPGRIAQLGEPGNLGQVAEVGQIEQALGRMCVSAVARIDHGRADALRDEIRRPRRPVPYDEDITAEGLERARGVEERFALLDRRARRRDVHDVGRERLRRELEGDARACRGLGEEEDHRAAAERRRAADRPREDLEHPVSGIEDVLDLLA